MPLYFSDLSHHNLDPINWSVYNATRDRVALKATESTGFTDGKFKERWNNTKGLRIAYHFARVSNNGRDEFNHFFSVLKAAGYTSKDCICLDVEDIDTPGYAKLSRDNALEFVNAAVAAGFSSGLIYSYRFYLNAINLRASDLPIGWRKLWIATYSSFIADNQVSLPDGWTRDQVVARQYTDKAGVAGVTGTCDDSRVVIEWMKNSPTTPTTPPQEDDDNMPSVEETRDISWSAVRAALTGHNNGDMPPAVTGGDLDSISVPAQLKAMEDRLNARIDGLKPTQ